MNKVNQSILYVLISRLMSTLEILPGGSIQGKYFRYEISEKKKKTRKISREASHLKWKISATVVKPNEGKLFPLGHAEIVPLLPAVVTWEPGVRVGRDKDQRWPSTKVRPIHWSFVSNWLHSSPALSRGNRRPASFVILNFLSSYVLKSEKRQVELILITCFNTVHPGDYLSSCDRHKNYQWAILQAFFLILSLQKDVYFIVKAHRIWRLNCHWKLLLYI